MFLRGVLWLSESCPDTLSSRLWLKLGLSGWWAIPSGPYLPLANNYIM